MRKITLKAPHTHEGKKYKTGEQIEVTDEQHRWMMKAIGARRILDRANREKQIGTTEWAEARLAKSKRSESGDDA